MTVMLMIWLCSLSLFSNMGTGYVWHLYNKVSNRLLLPWVPLVVVGAIKGAWFAMWRGRGQRAFADERRLDGQSNWFEKNESNNVMEVPCSPPNSVVEGENVPPPSEIVVPPLSSGAQAIVMSVTGKDFIQPVDQESTVMSVKGKDIVMTVKGTNVVNYVGLGMENYVVSSEGVEIPQRKHSRPYSYSISITKNQYVGKVNKT